MRSVLDMIRGTARLRVSGHRPERMLNLLSREGIWFTRAERCSEEGIVFTVLHGDLKRTLRLAGHAYFETELIRHAGLPSLAHRVRRRFALYLMPPLCLLAVFVLSMFIWEIEITGSETVSDAQLLSVLEENGVGIGTFGLTIDRELLRDKVIAALPKISWMTVNVNGCKAEVIVRERVDRPKTIDLKAPTDIIAAKTGLICEMSVFEGAKQAEKGDTVLKGELLITGTMPSLSGKTRRVHSQGVVKARTWYEFSEKIPLEYISKRYTGETKEKKSLIIGNYRLNLYFNGGISLDACDKIIYKERLSLPGGTLLPIEVVTAEYREYIAEPVRMNEDDAELILKDGLMKKLREETRGEPLFLEFQSTLDDTFLTVTLRAECMEDIALAVPQQ